jgi:hypothetical protein
MHQCNSCATSRHILENQHLTVGGKPNEVLAHRHRLERFLWKLPICDVNAAFPHRAAVILAGTSNLLFASRKWMRYRKRNSRQVLQPTKRRSTVCASYQSRGESLARPAVRLHRK